MGYSVVDKPQAREAVKVNIAVQWVDYKNLKEYADSTGQFMGAIIRKLIKQFLEGEGYAE